MNQTDHSFSTQKITPQLISQIIDAIKNKYYGSVEIYIQNYSVTQITERTITKITRTSIAKKLNSENNNSSKDSEAEINPASIRNNSHQ